MDKNLQDNKLSTPIEYKVSRNDWFTFLSIRKEYDKLVEQWKHYFYIQMINQFSNIDYPNGWAFRAGSVSYQKYFQKQIFTWFLKEFEYPDSEIGFNCVIKDNFIFGLSDELKNENLQKLYDSDEFLTLRIIFDGKMPTFYYVPPFTGLNDPEMLLWEMANNPDIVNNLNNLVKRITDDLELTELFRILNRAKQKLKESSSTLG
jgi:hypothetical protein